MKCLIILNLSIQQFQLVYLYLYSSLFGHGLVLSFKLHINIHIIHRTLKSLKSSVKQQGTTMNIQTRTFRQQNCIDYLSQLPMALSWLTERLINRWHIGYSLEYVLFLSQTFGCSCKIFLLMNNNWFQHQLTIASFRQYFPNYHTQYFWGINITWTFNFQLLFHSWKSPQVKMNKERYRYIYTVYVLSTMPEYWTSVRK